MDWWTLGILIYEMIVGQPPFCDEEPMGIYQKILAGKIYFPKYFDKNAKALVKKLVTADLSKRYGNLKAGSADVSGLFCAVYSDAVIGPRRKVHFRTLRRTLVDGAAAVVQVSAIAGLMHVCVYRIARKGPGLVAMPAR